jgi:hypothetical protein
MTWILESALRVAAVAVIERKLEEFGWSRAAALIATAWGFSEATHSATARRRQLGGFYRACRVSSPPWSNLLARSSTQKACGPFFGARLKGIPYKIFAVEWGARRGNLLEFILISIPARWIRFAFTCVATTAVATSIGSATHRSARVELSVLEAFWLILYALYFRRFGW